MNPVPDGWTATTLGQLGKYYNGRGFKKSEWADTGRPIIRIQNLTGSGTSFNYFNGHAEDHYIARSGDLLVAWAATLGAHIWPGPEAVVNQHIFKVVSNIDRRFHKYLLDFKLQELMQETHGSGIVHITRSRFDSLPVVVPPIEEQRRIVTILEDHLSRLDAAVAYTNQAIQRGRSVRSSILERLVSPSPTATVERLSSLAEGGLFCDGDWVESKDQDPNGTVRLTQLADIGVGEFRDRSNRWMRRDQAESLQCTYLAEGDILVARMPDPLARACLVPAGIGEAVTAVDVAVLRISRSNIHPGWLMWALNSPSFRARAVDLQSGTTRKRISRKNLGAIELAVPVLAEQQARFAAATEALDALARLLEESGRLLDRAGVLRRTVLAAAFDGRLTGNMHLREGA